MRNPAGVATLVFLLSAATVWACGRGEGYFGMWSLDHKDLAGNTGLPFLSPGNDSRINLQLLMLEEGPAAPHAAPPIDANAIDPPPALFQLADLAAVYAASDDAMAGAETTAAAAAAGLADGEGSRCLSLKGGAAAFAAAVRAEPSLSDAERKTLVDARAAMAPTCADAKPDAPSQIAAIAQPSPVARDFATYLDGAQFFYQGAFDQALTTFAGLAGSGNSWLRETARDMAARTLLNKAQVGAFATFDEVGLPKVTDKASLAASETEFKAYLGAYPAGRYAASAQGLMRRIYWLADDRQRLAAEYGRLVAHAPQLQASLTRVGLAQEVDFEISERRQVEFADAQVHDPKIIAVEDLMRMRANGQKKADFPAADLDRQAPDFAGHDQLFAYLRAARAYYVDGDARATLQLLGPAPAAALSSPFSGFSKEMLRGQALMAAGELPAAADHWKNLLPGATQPWQKEAVELGLASTWERLGTINKAFLPETRIGSTRIRQILLRRIAGPILLRMALADPQSTQGERNLVRSVLLFKEATRGQYGNFLRDFKTDELARDAGEGADGWAAQAKKFLWRGDSRSYACPALKDVIGELAARPASPHGLLCLGDFVRTQDLDSFEDMRPEAGELGAGKSIFPGEPFARGEIYKQLISSSTTPGRDRAYALYRAVRCYAPAGHNTCGGADVDKDQRKAWYDALKSKYGATAWAQQLRYFW